MICVRCGARMVTVGREIKPGDRNVWWEAWVCSQPGCPEYGAVDHEGTVSRWPAMTLFPEAPLHAMIRGAMKFRDSRRTESP